MGTGPRIRGDARRRCSQCATSPGPRGDARVGVIRDACSPIHQHVEYHRSMPSSRRAPPSPRQERPLQVSGSHVNPRRSPDRSRCPRRSRDRAASRSAHARAASVRHRRRRPGSPARSDRVAAEARGVRPAPRALADVRHGRLEASPSWRPAQARRCDSNSRTRAKSTMLSKLEPSADRQIWRVGFRWSLLPWLKRSIAPRFRGGARAALVCQRSCAYDRTAAVRTW